MSKNMSIWKASYKSEYNLKVALQFVCSEDFNEAKTKALQLAEKYHLTLLRLEQNFLIKGEED